MGKPVLFLAVLALAVSACGSPGGEAMTGGDLARDLGCVSCHTQVDTAQAPSWQGLAESTIRLSDGSEVVADSDYIRRSITEPAAQVAEGYRATMPLFDLTPEQVDLLVDYIMGLNS